MPDRVPFITILLFYSVVNIFFIFCFLLSSCGSHWVSSVAYTKLQGMTGFGICLELGMISETLGYEAWFLFPQCLLIAIVFYSFPALSCEFASVDVSDVLGTVRYIFASYAFFLFYLLECGKIISCYPLMILEKRGTWEIYCIFSEKQRHVEVLM